MLEITNLRNGSVLDHTCGTETAEYLEIPVEGLASSQSDVWVNDQLAQRCDRQFKAVVRLQNKINTITVKAVDYYGVKTQTITVAWDKKSFKRYNFFFDDCCFFLRWITLNRPQSIFDEMFLKRLRDIHNKYGSKFMLNLFYHDDHHDFCIADMPSDYKAEFQANADWLKLSFHAKSEFPDRPYQHADQAKLAADFDLIHQEICRFAGEEAFIPPMVIHWAITNPENFAVLKQRGTKCLSGGYLGLKAYLDEKHSVQVTDIGYHYEKDVAKYIVDKHLFYDNFYDLFLLNSLLCCNLDDMATIRQKFERLAQNPRHTIDLMSHEQYSYSDYFNYIPDHLDRVEEACRLATEAGYQPVWFPQGILGNTAWEN